MKIESLKLINPVLEGTLVKNEDCFTFTLPYFNNGYF